MTKTKRKPQAPVRSTRLVGLRNCSCGQAPRVSREDYVWIECPDTDDGCQDQIWASTPERAKALWNEEHKQPNAKLRDGQS